MIIKADKEGKDILVQLCDIALKTGGLQNMNAVQGILNSIQLIEEKDDSDLITD